MIIKNKKLFNSCIFVIFFWILYITTLILSLITILYTIINRDIFSPPNLLFYISYSPMILSIIFAIIFLIYFLSINESL